MLSSPNTAAYANRFPHDLAQQSDEIASVSQEMTMSSMVGPHHILRAVQGVDDADRTGFLADAGMHGSIQQSFGEQRQQTFLGSSNQIYLLIKVPTDRLDRFSNAVNF